MENRLEKLTGKTQAENEALYIASIDLMRAVGFEESTARDIARKVYKDTLNRCAEILNNKNVRLLAEIQIGNGIFNSQK